MFSGKTVGVLKNAASPLCVDMPVTFRVCEVPELMIEKVCVDDAPGSSSPKLMGVVNVMFGSSPPVRLVQERSSMTICFVVIFLNSMTTSPGTSMSFTANT